MQSHTKFQKNKPRKQTIVNGNGLDDPRWLSAETFSVIPPKRRGLW